MIDRNAPLPDYLELLDRTLRDSHPNVPRWSGHLVVEGYEDIFRDGPAGRWAIRLPAAEPIPAEAYAPRLEELRRRAYPWINLHAVGVLRGRLLVAIELPPGERREGEVAPGMTSLNLSRPFEVVRNVPGWGLETLLAEGEAGSGPPAA
jgi:hypothetical protein